MEVERIFPKKNTHSLMAVGILDMAIVKRTIPYNYITAVTIYGDKR